MKRGPSSFNEFLGLITGYAFGAVFGLGSFLRKSRLFHAQGLLFEGTAVSDFLPEYVIIRFSSALWKRGEYPDVLGLTLRFGEEKIQDILLVTTNRVWKLPFNMLTSHHKDFLSNTFHSITSFEVLGQRTTLRVLCEGQMTGETRKEKIRKAVRAGEARLRLQMQDENGWKDIAQIKLHRELPLDQDKLFFTPFHCAYGIKPLGFVNYLRLKSYPMSLLGRSFRKKLGATGHVGELVHQAS